MGTLGQYLHDARTELGIDLREAAQQTRISIHYLKALEDEDFSKLPGTVFVKGFLKSYAKYLRLDEAEVLRRFGELQQKKSPSAAKTEPLAGEARSVPSSKLSIEPFLWGGGIIILLVIFLFSAFPRGRDHTREAQQLSTLSSPTTTAPSGLLSAPSPTAVKPEKLYLEVVALENTWLLIRTDASPQKKATLTKGDSLIWSADERFLLSYGSAGALKLVLNGRELTVNEPKNAVVRDLAITSAGIATRKIRSEIAQPAKPKRKPAETAATTPKPAPTPEHKPVQSTASRTTATAPAPAAPAPAAPVPTPPQAQPSQPEQPRSETVTQGEQPAPQPMVPLGQN
jgi:cytoskeletal protein RodZ